MEVDGLAITEAWLPPNAYLPPHIHDRPCFAVMLDGSFDVIFRSAAYVHQAVRLAPRHDLAAPAARADDPRRPVVMGGWPARVRQTGTGHG